MVGIETSFWALVGWWLLRLVVVTLFCLFLGWLGIRMLDALTPKIHEREMIGKDPIATGFFIAGFLIYLGLVIHGSSTMPFFPAFKLITFRRLALIALCFFISTMLCIAIFNLLDRLTPKIHFRRIMESPIAVSSFVFGYLIFLGVIIHASLIMSL